MEELVFPKMIQGISTQEGFTKRELFAAMAMQGIVNALYSRMDHVDDGDSVINTSITYADALIAELEK